MEVKHIVMFSGGAASSYAAYLVIKKYGKKNVILLHTPTYGEHPDADRFRNEVAAYLGMPITIAKDGRDIWTLIEDNNCLPSFHIPFCTTELKIKQSRKFYKEVKQQGYDFITYFGYSKDEWNRVQKQSSRFASEGIKSAYPVFEAGISDTEIKDIITKEWGILLPQPYKYIKHNNCIPCWKAGKGHWRAVAKYYPEQFKRAMELEKKIGHTVFKDCTLEDIWEQAQSSSCQINLFDDLGVIPCMCAD